MTTRAAHVDAVDTDEAILETAEAATPDGCPVTFRIASLLDMTGPYDVITAVAVLHHLDLTSALRVLRSALAAGGRLLIVGCYREASLSDHTLTVLAAPLNIAIGAAKNAGLPHADAAPRPRTRPATTTFADVRSTIRTELPDARIRRALFWRYLVTYDAPRPPNLASTETTVGPHVPTVE